MSGSIAALREDLLARMDRKHHWAWPHFHEGRASRRQLLRHFQQEFEAYIRDFPVFLSRVHSNCPHPEVRRDLAENLYEEETGKLSTGLPHPELFLRMMEGLGFPRAAFHRVKLLPEAAAYRGWIDRVTTRRPWIEGAALVTIFIEGSVEDRRRIEEDDRAFDPEELERDLRRSPLVRFYGVDPAFLDLKRAHAMVESGHRRMAWKMVLDHAGSAAVAARLCRVMDRSLELWLRYRDAVARACRIDLPVAAAAGRESPPPRSRSPFPAG